jgi:Ras GTPase-activating protein-binding protein 2
MLSSVDSLASSGGGIVIQVLGELSNRDEPSQKFAETFFLAEQPNGYFVLNDIFRYLKEDVESDYEETDPEQLSESAHGLGEELHSASNGISNGFRDPSPISPEPQIPQKEGLTALESSLGLLSAEETLEQTSPLAVVPPLPRSNGMAVHGSPLPDQPAQQNVVVVESLSPVTQPSEDLPTTAQSDVVHGISSVQSKSQIAESLSVETPIPAQGPTPPVRKSWASLAATNSEKWHVPLDQRVEPPTSPSSGKPVVPSRVHKDPPKPFAAGIHLSLLD